MLDHIHIHMYNSPVIATAIHDGHYIPITYLKNMILEEHARAREEDPYTIYLTELPANRVTVSVSRFFTDLNRSKNKCIYRTPEDAWNLHVWKAVSKTMEKQSLDYYDQFYKQIAICIEKTIASHGHFVLLDLHSYNHRRRSPREEEDAGDNPEINIGTVHNQGKWASLTQAFIQYLSQSTIQGHLPDVRENIKFKGGAFAKWICQHYGDFGCVLSVEFKKTFMDEWTGRVNIHHLKDLQNALAGSIPLLKYQLRAISIK